MGILSALLSPYITYVGFQKADTEPHQEMRNYLLDRFECGQKLNSALLEKLSSINVHEHRDDAPLMQGLTVSKTIHLLENSLAATFNSATLSHIKLTKGWTPFHQDTLDRIEDTITCIGRLNKALVLYI